MSKYDNYVNYEETLPNPLMEGENVIWSAKPKKSAFIINKILVMMPFALLWILVDFFIIMSMVGTGQLNEMLFFIIPFFIFHLIPVWIWIGNCVTANKKWKNTKYYVTDRRIIIQTGIIGASYQTIYYKDIKNVNLRIGVIDKLLGVGDIYIDMGILGGMDNSARSAMSAIIDIENPYEIYPKIQKIVLDIQSDVEFPNAYRPSENPGYNTKYNG